MGQYHGSLPNLEVQLDEYITVKVNVVVVDTSEPYFIIGQDILGGSNSLLWSLNNSSFCCILVVDNVTGNVGTIYYVKNIEHTLLPIIPPLSSLDAAKTEPVGFKNFFADKRQMEQCWAQVARIVCDEVVVKRLGQIFVGISVPEHTKDELFTLLQVADSMSYWKYSDDLGC